MNRRQAAIAAFFCAAILTGPLTPRQAHGADTVGIRIREAALDRDGGVRVIVAVSGAFADRILTSRDFKVTEAGGAVGPVTATPLLSVAAEKVSVVLAIDVSGSTAGRPLADAKAAAKRFVSLLPARVRVALVAFGAKAGVVQGFTTDRRALARAIDRLRAGGDTALYDGVVLSAARLIGETGQHNIVVFSDGKDTSSRARLGTAVDAARRVKAPVTTVGLITKDYDVTALSRLARETGGRTLEVGASHKLAEAFGEAARDIASQYVLTYSASAVEPKELELSVTVAIGPVTASDQVVVVNPRVKVPAISPEDVPRREARPLIGALANRVGRLIGLAAVFFAVLLFLWVIVSAPYTDRATKVLRSLAPAGQRQRGDPDESRWGLGGAARTAVSLVERVPTREGFDKRFQLALDRAGWPLRSSEFLTVQLAASLAGALLGFGLFARWWLGILLVVAGASVPRLLLRRQIQRRSNAFLAQLPDTLELLAGSLQAGYGLMQALDTLVQEAQPPTSTEFSRVLTEARLGMPVEDAMMLMADRLVSEDFRWVVLAINIQRQVGGNLAALLKSVAQTLREREQVHRQIRVLSAEGRLSAVILVTLPFLLAGYIALVNPGYIGKLFEETVGRIMLAGALCLMATGIAWMRKLIRIDV